MTDTAGHTKHVFNWMRAEGSGCVTAGKANREFG